MTSTEGKLVDKQYWPHNDLDWRVNIEAAIIAARQAFTHVIRISYEDGHELVTDGIYRHEEFFLRQFFGSQSMLESEMPPVVFHNVWMQKFIAPPEHSSKEESSPNGNYYGEPTQHLDG